MQKRLHRITLNAMLAALFVGLSYLAADLGVIKFTFAPIAIILAGFLFGPWDAFAVALVGATLEQLLKYGISVTLPLWVIPALARGLLVPVMYFDAWLFDYLQYTEIFGLALVWRYVSGIVCSILYTVLTVLLLNPISRALRAKGTDVLWKSN